MARSRFANDFLIGCDPEFVCLEDGHLVNLQGKIAQGGKVGWDHGGYVGEVRPDPTKGTYTLIKRIQTLIHTTGKKLHKYSWRAGGYGKWRERNQALGGHVHLDFTLPNRYNEDENGKSFTLQEKRRYADQHRDRITACEHFMTTLVGLDLLNKKATEARLGQSNYGDSRDVRVVPGGRFGAHIEYRAPISWLYSPELAFLVLTGIKLCFVSSKTARDKLGGPRSYNKIRDFLQSFKNDVNARRFLSNVFPNIKKVSKDPSRIEVVDAWRNIDF